MIRLFLHTQNRQASDLWTLFLKLKKNGTHNSTGAAQVCGFHQDLKPYLGCAFDKEDRRAVKMLTTDISEGGILRWSQQGLALASKCPHGDTLVEKQLHIVSYMFEVMADIMIEPKHNMSDSGSFEMFLMGKNQM